MRCPNRWREEEGFTLIELMVVMILLGVLGTAILQVIRTATNAQKVTSHLAEAMDDARISVDRMSKQLRGARRVTDVDSDANTLVFWVDQDQDDVQEAQEVFIWDVQTIAGQGNRFQIVSWTEDDPTATRIVAETLLNPDAPATVPSVFRYWGTDGAELLQSNGDDLSLTEVVTMSMDFRVDSPRANSAVEVTTNVRLRNVGSA